MGGKRIGWVQIVVGLVVLGLAIRYWWITIPVVAVVVGGLVWRRHYVRSQAKQAAQRARLESERAAAKLLVEMRSEEERQEARKAHRYALLGSSAPLSHRLPHDSSVGGHAARTAASPVAPPMGLVGEREFDVALSFAGEDRVIAHALANELQARGIEVFYDEFATAEMWGADLVAYFDAVFRWRARYVAVFVSRYYVRKPWTNLERQSVQARFLTDAAPSLLPIRLDDSELPGTPPTVGYVDARQTSVDEIASLVVEKLGRGRAEGGDVGPIERVPRTVREEALLVATRPPGWEYLLFASVLLRRRDALDAKLRDHVSGFVRPRGPVLDEEETVEMLSAASRHVQAIAENVERILTPQSVELAMGKPGEPGNPVQIEYLARRLIDCYEDFLDWSERLRSAAVAARFERPIELLSSFADEPVGEIRAFVDLVVTEIERIVPLLLENDTAEPIRVSLTLTLTLDEKLVADYRSALARAIL